MAYREYKKSELNKMYSKLKSIRQPNDAYYTSLRDMFSPGSGKFPGDKANDVRDRFSGLLDISPYHARRIMASGMMAGITSPARPWFRMGIEDKDLAEIEAVKVWLSEVTKRMLATFRNSNLYNVLPKVYSEFGTFGTAAFAGVFDFKKVVRFQHFTMGEYYIGVNSEGKVDTLFRDVEMTISQIVELSNRVGGKVSEKVKRKFKDGDYYDTLTIRHAYIPNRNHKQGSAFNKFKKFVSCYYEIGEDSDENLVALTGHDIFNVMIPRWEVNEGDAWGIDCPGMASLPDSKQLQSQQRRKAKAVATFADPPLQASVGSGSKPQFNILPGTVTPVDPNLGKDGVRPIYTASPQIAPLLDDIDRTKNRIDITWFADLFQMLTMLDRKQITAREIEERHEEKLLMLGPVLERLHADMLDPVIDITFDNMLKAGVLPPVPKELEGHDIKVEYISVLAQAQNASGIGALERLLDYTTRLAQASGNQSVWDKFDGDQSVDEMNEMLGAPVRVVVPDERVAEVRQERAEAQQRQAQMEMAQQSADTLQSGASAIKTMSEVSSDEQ